MENNINLSALIDSAPMCIKLFDHSGNLIFINKYGRNEHHLSENESVSNWNWRNTIKKEYQEAVDRKFSEILKGSPIEYVEFEHTKEGSDHEWCSGALSSVKDEKGLVSGILFYSIDITDKKKLEKDLTERIRELEKINKIIVNRELKMIDLKKELEETRKKCNNTDNEA